MPTESVVFSPVIPDRELDREASKVDDRLEESGQITPELGELQGDVDMSGMGGLGMPDRGGGGLGGAGGAGAAAGIASKIPKPIAGVTAGAALPMALVGGVGIGLLSAMQGASARLQTSATLLGQAWNNLFRPLGDSLDQLFVRDLTEDLVDATQDFEETWRADNPGQAIDALSKELGTILPENLGDAIAVQIRQSIGGEGGDMLANAVEAAFSDFNAANAMSGPIGAIEEVIEAMVDASTSLISDAEFGDITLTKEDITSAFTIDDIGSQDLLDKFDIDSIGESDLLNKFTIDPIGQQDLLGEITFDDITAPTLLNQPTWDNISAPALLREFDIQSLTSETMLPALFAEPITKDNLLNLFGTVDGPTLRQNVFPKLQSLDVLDETFGTVVLDEFDILNDLFGGINMNLDDILEFLGGGGNNNQDDDDNTGIPPEDDKSDTDPTFNPGGDGENDDDNVSNVDVPGDRTYDDQTDPADNDLGPGDRAYGGTSRGSLQQEMKRTRRAVENMSIEVDGETLGRVTAESQRDDVTDTDPLVR